MNTIIRSILTLFTSCKHGHQYYIGIIQIFELRIFNFLKAYVTPSTLRAVGFLAVDKARNMEHPRTFRNISEHQIVITIKQKTCVKLNFLN